MTDYVKSIAHSALESSTKKVAATMFSVLFFGVFAVSASLWNHGTIWSGLLWAGAWSSVGWFLGFLFGIPRYLSTDTARKPTAPSQDFSVDELAKAAAKALREATNKAVDLAAGQAAAQPEAKQPPVVAAGKAVTDTQEAANALIGIVERSSIVTAAASGPSLTVNTNLEQISDWLTKIIVGVSLVESQTLLDKMKYAASYMAKSMESANVHATLSVSQSSATSAASAPSAASAAFQNIPASSVESFAYAIMLYFLATGLLGSYLLTRLFLQKAFDDIINAEPKVQ